jgi:hypothetical protein
MKTILKASYFANVLLLILCLFFVFSWKNMTGILTDGEKETASKLHNARFVTALVQAELHGISKQYIVDTLNGIYASHPEYKSIFPEYISQTVSCIYYGGADLVFKDDVFVYFDDNFQCRSIPVNGGLFNIRT